jgi:hypothetical protein
MTHDQKINWMRIAAGVAGFGMKTEHFDLLVSVYELILEKKGNTTVEDAIEIEEQVKKRADAKNREQLLDSVSEKV